MLSVVYHDVILALCKLVESAKPNRIAAVTWQDLQEVMA
jgi:hypothetical protein